MKKKPWAIALALLLTLAVLSGCGATRNSGGSAEGPDTSEPQSPAEVNTAEATGASLTTNGGSVIALSSLEHLTDSEDAPEVFFISDISSEQKYVFLSQKNIKNLGLQTSQITMFQQDVLNL